MTRQKPRDPAQFRPVQSSANERTDARIASKREELRALRKRTSRMCLEEILVHVGIWAMLASAVALIASEFWRDLAHLH
jgi:hypothetical protein